MERGTEELFDRPSSWRREAILVLDLQGEERVAGAVTGAGYPDALAPLLQRAAPGERWADVGAGLGAASTWLADRRHVDVVAVEPEPTSAFEATVLFPELCMVVGAATCVPLASASLDGVALLGVLSLVPDLDAVLAEIRRVLRPDGRVVITDLWAVPATRDPDDAGTNIFRPVADFVAAIEAMGATVEQVWSAPGDLATRWDDVGQRVDEEIARAHGRDPRFGPWHDDRARVREQIQAGRLRLGTLVATLA